MIVRIKICGVTNRADADWAVQLGADALGVNFFPQSPRYVAPEQAAAIINRLPPFVEPVALVVNEPMPRIVAMLEQLGAIRTIQWHGDDPPVYSGPYRFIPAFPVVDESSLARISAYLDRCRGQAALPAAILVDGHRPGSYGGTGHTLPWQLLADFQPGVPLILAGGLTPDNVADAIRTVRPFAVDVAGGVESAPGHKDHRKLQQFIAQVRAAASTL